MKFLRKYLGLKVGKIEKEERGQNIGTVAPPPYSIPVGSVMPYRRFRSNLSSVVLTMGIFGGFAIFASTNTFFEDILFIERTTSFLLSIFFSACFVIHCLALSIIVDACDQYLRQVWRQNKYVTYDQYMRGMRMKKQ